MSVLIEPFEYEAVCSGSNALGEASDHARARSVSSSNRFSRFVVAEVTAGGFKNMIYVLTAEQFVDLVNLGIPYDFKMCYRSLGEQ